MNNNLNEYYINNKEKRLIYQRNYYKKNRSIICNYHKKYYEKNKNNRLLYQKIYYLNNKKSINEYNKKYYEIIKNETKKCNIYIDFKKFIIEI